MANDQVPPGSISDSATTSAADAALTLTMEVVGGVQVVHAIGRLDTITADRFDARVQQGLSPDTTHVVLDLSRVTYVSSAGLRSLLTLLKRVKAQVVAAQIYKRDSVFGQGMEIGMNEMTGLSWRSIDRQLEKIKAVTSAQIQHVAQTYFNEDNLVVATLLPQPIDPNKPARKPVPGMRDEGGLR